MYRSLIVTTLLLAFSIPTSAQEVTGLSGWDIFLDPGHSRFENQGVFGYSEAQKNLAVGLELRELLLSTTDIDTVYMSRTNSQQEVGLSARVDFANTVGASHFHSIHSNAAGPSANHLFVLWPQYRDGTEAIPNGGKRMAELMAEELGMAMRINSQGGIGECDFYGVSSCRGRDLGTGKGGSRNFVQSFTAMPSELSEAGFHTNPEQNQLNMNADWKRLEARAKYWSILEFHELPRPDVGILTGIVSDIEDGMPINGAVVTVGDTSYVTDTYESLFHEYSNDPDELRNGFYYLDNFQPGAMVDVTIDAPGYESASGSVTLNEDFFTFHDVQLTSEIPPVVESTTPEAGEERFRIIDPIILEFSRQMDPTSVEDAFSIAPETDGTFTWSDSNTRLVFRPDTLLPDTDYTLRIEDTAVGEFGHGFDGDADIEAGGAFVLNFRAGPLDPFAPIVLGSYPRVNSDDVPREAVITLVFDEALTPSSVTNDLFELTRADNGAVLPGTVEYYLIRDTSFVSFYPESELEGGVDYRLDIEPGLADFFGNIIDRTLTVRFETTFASFDRTSIDLFEAAGDGVWWQPQQSGSTTGIETDSTSFEIQSDVVHLTSGSSLAGEIQYGWDRDEGTHLIREYLGGGDARSVFFDTDVRLQAHVFGDGSENQIRFAIDEGETSHEVSPWFTVDWYGWQLVEWDLSEGETGSWIGDGVLDGTLRFDSFQLTHAEGGAQYGTIYVDNLRLARMTDTFVEDGPELPGQIELFPNYPNPFNPSTTLRFALGSTERVTLAIYDALGREVATLVSDEMFSAGRHEVSWDASSFPSGLYVARLSGSSASKTIKLILTK